MRRRRGRRLLLERGAALLANLKRGEIDEPTDQEGGSAARQTTGAGSTQAGGHTDPALASPAWIHPGRRQLPPERERCRALEWPSVGRGQRSSSGQAADSLGRRRTYPCLRDQETRNTRSWAAVEEEGRLSATPNLQKNSGLGGHRRKKARSRKMVVEGKGSLKVDWPVKATRTERRRLPIRGQHVSTKRLGTTLPVSHHQQDTSELQSFLRVHPMIRPTSDRVAAMMAQLKAQQEQLDASTRPPPVWTRESRTIGQSPPPSAKQ